MRIGRAVRQKAKVAIAFESINGMSSKRLKNEALLCCFTVGVVRQKLEKRIENALEKLRKTTTPKYRPLMGIHRPKNVMTRLPAPTAKSQKEGKTDYPKMPHSHADSHATNQQKQRRHNDTFCNFA